MDFLPTLPSYGSDLCAQTVWSWYEELLREQEGTAYYKHPIVGTSGAAQPDLTILTRLNHPIVVKIVKAEIDDLLAVGDERWTIQQGGREEDILAPDAEIEEVAFLLQQRFDRERPIRNKLHVRHFVALPIISPRAFAAKFGRTPQNCLWQQNETAESLLTISPVLTDDEWKIAKSVVQAAMPLNKPAMIVPRQGRTMGDAIKMLDSAISVLDIEQEKVAIQIPPGPQRIRGLAGTGKTVLLAQKAANIHRHFPQKKVLFTFHTQSLYNQSKALISKFYRYHSDEDPDWNMLHIRHSWGGKARNGVYSDLCARQGQIPMDLHSARAADPEQPFRACCNHALKHKILPEYDYVLVDEAQDFPTEFYKLLYEMTHAPHAIYWAYDELQSLSSIEIPDPADLFGKTEAGDPRITLEGTYPGRIEKDFVLHRSYRCPQKVLMLAHALGLGIHGPNGPVQMLGTIESWRSIGYEVESELLTPGTEVAIRRPKENSPNPIEEIYSGSQHLITAAVFPDRDSEVAWVADSIVKTVREENVPPEQIIVISLDSRKSRQLMIDLQNCLVQQGIASTIPGLIDSSSEFAEPGRVTLATVFRAKGNEAPVVYVMAFEALYSYLHEIENRNMAFTSISRSKGFVRITGIGQNMERAKSELKLIANDIPYFRFTFPDMARIRNLDAEVTRRRREHRKAKQAVQALSEIDLEALKSLEPDLLQRMLDSLVRSGALSTVDSETVKQIERRLGKPSK